MSLDELACRKPATSTDEKRVSGQPVFITLARHDLPLSARRTAGASLVLLHQAVDTTWPTMVFIWVA